MSLPAPRRAVAPVLARTAVLWLVPFLVSVPLVDAGGAPRIGLVPFKAVMIAALVAAAWWVRRRPAPGVAPARAAVVYVLGQLLLDLVVLVALLGLPVGTWLATVAPVYAVVPPLVAWRARPAPASPA